MSNIKVLFINCTLKKSPSKSNTDALITRLIKLYKKHNFKSESIRVVDYNIKFGVSGDEGHGDEWPLIYNKIKLCNILIIASPTWSNGHPSSVCSLVFERLNDTYYNDLDKKTGQFCLYNKVGGAIATGNADGAREVIKFINFNLNQFGATIPPNSDTYWNRSNNNGAMLSYIESKGQHTLYTNRMNHFMVTNTAFFAKLLKTNPITTNIHKIQKDAKKESY
jgi:multimeric flavodoxin WrbA